MLASLTASCSLQKANNKILKYSAHYKYSRKADRRFIAELEARLNYSRFNLTQQTPSASHTTVHRRRSHSFTLRRDLPLYFKSIFESSPMKKEKTNQPFMELDSITSEFLVVASSCDRRRFDKFASGVNCFLFSS